MKQHKHKPARTIIFNPHSTILHAENYGDIVLSEGHDGFLWHPALEHFALSLFRRWIMERRNITEITQWAKQQKVKITKYPYNRTKKEKA